MPKTPSPNVRLTPFSATYSAAALIFVLLLLLSVWNTSPCSAQIIAIDAGHSASTPGKRSAPFQRKVTRSNSDWKVTVPKGFQYREHFANAGVAFYLHQYLQEQGFQCVKVAWNDINGTDDLMDLSLTERLNQIRASGAQISISCHFNAFGDGQTFNSAHGVEVWTWDTAEPERCRKSVELAQLVQKNLVKETKLRDRGVKHGHFALTDCGRSGCEASILLELAFMTNEKEAADFFCNPKAWKVYARAVAEAVCEYTGKKWKK